jgi:hypothetical protein
MVDYVKIKVQVPEVEEFLNKIGDPEQWVNRITGELEPFCVVSSKNLTFKGYDTGKIFIKGSLHKWFNDGDHNHNDFSFTDLNRTIHEIFDRFEVPLSEFKLQNVEFGVNITPPYATDRIIDSLVLHKKSPFKDVSIRGGNYKQVEYNQYFVKVYNKGYQYGLTNERLRFEIKVRSMCKLGEYKIKNLEDLLDKDKLSMINGFLLNHWDKVLMIDPSAVKPILPNDKYHQWINPSFWRTLTIDPRKNKLSREKEAFLAYQREHSQNLHQKIRELINHKWIELIVNVNDNKPPYKERVYEGVGN